MIHSSHVCLLMLRLATSSLVGFMAFFLYGYGPGTTDLWNGRRLDIPCY